ITPMDMACTSISMVQTRRYTISPWTISGQYPTRMINLYLIRRMKRKYTGILPGLLCLTLSLVLLTSCDDDDDKNSGQIELLSFGPSGVLHGEQIKLIGNNLDKVTAVLMPVGVEVPSSAFDSQSSEVI